MPQSVLLPASVLPLPRRYSPFPLTKRRSRYAPVCPAQTAAPAAIPAATVMPPPFPRAKQRNVTSAYPAETTLLLRLVKSWVLTPEKLPRWSLPSCVRVTGRTLPKSLNTAVFIPARWQPSFSAGQKPASTAASASAIALRSAPMRPSSSATALQESTRAGAAPAKSASKPARDSL